MLLIRLDAIGDALALTPLLAALRARDIPVDIVLRDSNYAALSPRAARGRFTAPFAQRSQTRDNRRAIETFGDRLRANGYTHTLVATEDPGGYLLARRVASPVRAGFVNGWGKPLKTLLLRTVLTAPVYRSAGLDPRAPHESAVLFELGRSLLGAGEPTRDTAILRPLVLDNDVPPSPSIVMQITDKWERLGIALDDVVRMLDLAGRCGGVRAIGAASEAAYAGRVAAASGVAVELFEQLGDWKAAIAGARALVAPDCGAVHVAGMVGTPTVAVFPAIADFALQTSRWAPWAAPSRIVCAHPHWPVRALESLRELLEPAQSAR